MGDAALETRNLVIERDCLRLVAQYVTAADVGDCDPWPNIFAEDGVWQTPTRTLSGRGELKDFFLARTDGKTSLVKHISANAVVDVVDDHTAQAWSSMPVRSTD